MPDDKQDLKTIAVQWATGQPFNNVLLIAIFCGGAYAGHYLMTVAIPSHLKQIQDGYERIEESHKADRQLIIEQYDKWFQSIRNNGDATGAVTPGEVIHDMWESFSEQTDGQTEYAQALGIGFEADIAALLPEENDGTIQAKTSSGIEVSWIASSARKPGESRHSKLRWGGGEPRDGRDGFDRRTGGVPIRDGGIPSMPKWWRATDNRF